MKEFSISYAYSATLLAESAKKGLRLSNNLIAFAPVYTRTINIDSVLLTRHVRLSGIKIFRLPTGSRICFRTDGRNSVHK